MDLHSLNTEDGCICGKPVIPGLATTLYAIHACDVETFPEVGAYDPANPAASVTLSGDIVPKAGKHFVSVPIILDLGHLDNELIGSVGSKSFTNKLYFNLAGTEAETLAWHQRTGNGCMIFIAKEKSGNRRVIGNLDVPAHYETLTVSNGPTESQSVSVVFDTTGKVAPIYTGTITLEDSGE
jgi:hypothetical protein